MGYTHYFKTIRKISNKETIDISKAIDQILGSTNIPMEGPMDDRGTVRCYPGGVSLNGKGEDSHEDFIFPGNAEFEFCKTSGKPYDEVVTAILVAVNHVAPGAFKIRSDGDLGDWEDGLRLACEATGNAMSVPPGVSRK